MTIRYFAAACLLLAAPSAVAQTQTPAGPSLSLTTIEQRLASDGFRVVEIERYPNSVEVKGYDRSGQCTEMRLNPRTGAVLHRESDDDCDRSDRSHSSDSSGDRHRRRGGR